MERGEPKREGVRRDCTPELCLQFNPSCACRAEHTQPANAFFGCGGGEKQDLSSSAQSYRAILRDRSD